MTAEVLIQQTLARCHAAREAGLPVSQARAIDVFRALSVIDWQHLDDYRIDLRRSMRRSVLPWP